MLTEQKTPAMLNPFLGLLSRGKQGHASEAKQQLSQTDDAVDLIER